MSNPQVNIPQFDAASKKELEDYIDQQQAKAKIQAQVHDLTQRCWNTCVTGGISSKFSRGEASCLENCVDRFLDSSLYLVKQLEAQQTHL
ncbi:mitochondrial import inner membrane translocase subunit TIM8 [Tremella mesenterica]|uniref:Mitochondrial import inner membrane translocase subunit n=1 Tax=Tremella mesenterica TaxID=5217 RepID=A0A4Q1BL07_TREME|nr:mitochondrial import inner membrane translocase subunit TIM8 [Tremella mesenterica]